MLVGSLAVPGIVAILAAVWFGSSFFLVVPLALGLAAAVGRQAFDALVQQHAPASDRGRSFARFESLFQMAWVIGALIPVVSDAGARLGFAILGALLAAGAVAHGLLRRSALQLDAGLRSVRARLLEDEPEVTLPIPGSPAAELLERADRLAASDPRWAVLAAASALDATLSQTRPGSWPPPGADGDGALADWTAAQELRSSAVRGDRLDPSDVAEAIASVRRVIASLDAERGGPPSGS